MLSSASMKTHGPAWAALLWSSIGSVSAKAGQEPTFKVATRIGLIDAAFAFPDGLVPRDTVGIEMYLDERHADVYRKFGIAGNGAGWLTRTISLISMWWDTWIVDGSVRLGAFLVELASFPIRLIQDGEMQEYMLIIVIGLIGFLGYTVYLLHWMR